MWFGAKWQVNVIKMLLNFFFNYWYYHKKIFWVLRKWFLMVQRWFVVFWRWFGGGWGVSTDLDRLYHFTKIISFRGYRIIIIIIIIITQDKSESRTTCPISCFVFIFTIQSYPALQMATYWICIYNTTTRYFRTLKIMITSHQGYMSVPVAWHGRIY